MPETKSPNLTHVEPQPPTSTNRDISEDNATSDLPHVLRVLLKAITDTLFAFFSQAPPHTIQRLAELILMPRANYRTLPSYLHALDRVVHVTSPATLFPLPLTKPDPNSIALPFNSGGPVGGIDPLSITWGNSVSTTPGVSAVGSDEALGGALLTPITWIKQGDLSSPLGSEVITQKSQEFVEGPNGSVGVETVSISINEISPAISTDNSGSKDSSSSTTAESEITQSEPLRKEQDVGMTNTTQILDSKDCSANDEEVPHARGPKDIGVEDLGPQLNRNSEVRKQSDGVETMTGTIHKPESGSEVSKDTSSGDTDVQNSLGHEILQQSSKDDTILSQKREASDSLPFEQCKRGKYDTNQIGPGNENMNEQSIPSGTTLNANDNVETSNSST